MTRATARVATAADRPEVVALGTRVLVEEQGAPPGVEQDAADATAVARGGGYGAAVPAEVALHAQVTARGSHERAGCTALGGEHTEAGIVHVTMWRRP